MSQYNPKIHNRQSRRVKGYDYSQPGFHFITICVQNRQRLLGEINNGGMRLTEAGKMVELEWLNLPERFRNIELHEFVVMPDHFHAILEIVKGAPPVGAPFDGQKKRDSSIDEGQQGIAPVSGIEEQSGLDSVIKEEEPSEMDLGELRSLDSIGTTLGDIMGAFKSISTVQYIHGVKTFGWKTFDRRLWQRNYYERIFYGQRAYHNISKYIKNNPAKWKN
jgi:putative transposase